jgi:hypothetical protein
MKFAEWFDINNIQHLQAWLHLYDVGEWPKDFKPKDIDIEPGWEHIISHQMAKKYANEKIKAEKTVTERISLLSHVKKWLEQSNKARKGIASYNGDQVVIHVVPIEQKYDFQLGDELTKLDLDLAEMFPLCNCEVLQVPDRQLRTKEELIFDTSLQN